MSRSKKNIKANKKAVASKHKTTIPTTPPDTPPSSSIASDETVDTPTPVSPTTNSPATTTTTTNNNTLTPTKPIARSRSKGAPKSPVTKTKAKRGGQVQVSKKRNKKAVSKKKETNEAGMTIVKLNSPSRRSTRSRTVTKSYAEEYVSDDSEEEVVEEKEEKRRVQFDGDEYDVSRPKGFYGLLGQDWRSKDVMDY